MECSDIHETPCELVTPACQEPGHEGIEVPRDRPVHSKGHLVAIGRAGFTVFMVALPGREAMDRFASEVNPLVRDELAAS